MVPNLKKLVTSAVEVGLDVAADAFFAGANDLVVNTSHAWSIGVTPDEVLKSFPKWIDPKRVLLFRPPHTNLKVPRGHHGRGLTGRPSHQSVLAAQGSHHHQELAVGALSDSGEGDLPKHTWHAPVPGHH